MKTINLNQKISILRKEKGLSQEELALARARFSFPITGTALWKTANCTS